MRHSLLSVGWTMLGAGHGLETFWVKNLDLCENKNALDGLKLELAFTGRFSSAGHPGLGLSLEACKVTTRRWEPRVRGEDGNVVILPHLKMGVIVAPGAADGADEAPIDDAAERLRWEQSFGLVLPAGTDGTVAMARVQLQDDGDAEDGGYHAAESVDAEAVLPSELVPRAALLLQSPTVKKMAKRDEERVLSAARACLVAAGLPVGLAPVTTSSVTEGKGASAEDDTGGSSGRDAIDLTAKEAAEASLARGECTAWAKGAAAAHSIGRAAPPMFFNGKGETLAQVLPRPAAALRPTSSRKYEDGDKSSYGWDDNGASDSCAPAAVTFSSAKVVASCFVDLARVAAVLGALPPLAAAAATAKPSSLITFNKVSTGKTALPAKKGGGGAKPKEIVQANAPPPAPFGASVNKTNTTSARSSSGSGSSIVASGTKTSKLPKRPLSEVISPPGGGMENDRAIASSSSDAVASNNVQPLAVRSSNKTPPLKKSKKSSPPLALADAAPTPGTETNVGSKIAPPLPSAEVRNKLKVAELKEMCKKHGVAPLRTKTEMLAQLASLA